MVSGQWANLARMAVQTEVTLQNIGYVSDLGPHMKVTWA